MSAEAKLYALPPRQPGLGHFLIAGNNPATLGTGWTSPRMWPGYALVLSIAGKAQYRDANGYSSEIYPGDIICVFPNLPHEYGPMDSALWTEEYIAFAGPEFDIWMQSGLFNPQQPILRTGDARLWQESFRAVLSNQSATMPDALARLFTLLADLSHVGDEKTDFLWLQKAKKMLLDYRDIKEIDLPQIARQCGLSYENFRRKFCQVTGESPGAYRSRNRLEAAARLLLRSDQPIKSVARTLGYCDEFHFSKQFRQHFGSSPKNYLMRQQS